LIAATDVLTPPYFFFSPSSSSSLSDLSSPVLSLPSFFSVVAQVDPAFPLELASLIPLLLADET
jgi:hypothetical protein